jgi:hypothetical protein
VAAGRVSEADLIRAGLLLPGAKGRRRAAPPWRRNIEQMRTSAEAAPAEPTAAQRDQ